MESVRGAGYIITRELIRRCSTASRVRDALKRPGRRVRAGATAACSLMDLYEVQVLDSYDNPTYADGQASAIYGQYPPLVNASRKPGEWQAYDIIFRRPRFNPDGGLAKPARFTVLHNGVLVQDNVEAWGTTTWLQSFGYPTHADRLPLSFQDHGNPVRFRNVWLRELPESPRPGPPAKPAKPLVSLAEKTLDLYTGTYEQDGTPAFAITRKGNQMSVKFFSLAGIDRPGDAFERGILPPVDRRQARLQPGLQRQAHRRQPSTSEAKRESRRRSSKEAKRDSSQTRCRTGMVRCDSDECLTGPNHLGYQAVGGGLTHSPFGALTGLCPSRAENRRQDRHTPRASARAAFIAAGVGFLGRSTFERR